MRKWIAALACLSASASAAQAQPVAPAQPGGQTIVIGKGKKLVVPPLPAPPPKVPAPRAGRGAPFDPDQVREAVPHPPIELPREAEPALNPALVGPEACVALALQLQPDVITARARLDSLQGSEELQRSNLLPTISGTSQFTRSDNFSADDDFFLTYRRLSNSVGLNQLIFDWGHTRDLVLQANLRKQSAAALLLTTENDLALTVKIRFYSTLQAQRLLEVAQLDLTQRQEQLRMVRALYQAGNRSPGDVVRAQTTVSNSVLALNNARRTLDLARQDLAQSIGLDPLRGFALIDEDEPDLPTKDVGYLNQEAALQRPDLLSAQKEVDASRAGLSAAHTQNYPSVEGFTGATYSGFTNYPQYPSISVQLAVRFQLYDAGVRAAQIKIAQANVERDTANLRRTLLSVEREVSGVLMQLLTAERNLEATRAAVDSSRQGIRIALGRYQAALGTITDVFDAQSQFVASSTNYVNSLTDLDLARARLRHALAAPFEEGYLRVPGAPPPIVVPQPIPLRTMIPGAGGPEEPGGLPPSGVPARPASDRPRPAASPQPASETSPADQGEARPGLPQGGVPEPRPRFPAGDRNAIPVPPDPLPLRPGVGPARPAAEALAKPAPPFPSVPTSAPGKTDPGATDPTASPSPSDQPGWFRR